MNDCEGIEIMSTVKAERRPARKTVGNGLWRNNSSHNRKNATEKHLEMGTFPLILNGVVSLFCHCH
jgi:hypothetical protein